MNNVYSYLTPMIESFNIIPKIVQLYFPPINWKGDPKGHIGNSDAFFLVVDGECCVIIEGESHILRSGDLVFMPKGKMRSYFSMCKELTMYEINFEAYVNGKPWNEALGVDMTYPVIHTGDVSSIAKLFEDSLRYEMNKDPMYDVIFCANIALVIKEFLLKHAEKKKLTTPFDEVISYMHKNVEKALKLSELASISYMQPTYFVKKFKLSFKESPIVYFNKLKVYRAMTLFATTDMSVYEVSKAVGVYDNSYFSRMFKKYTNMTPSEYKGII